jgi:ribosomal protein S18 acetylase RimI-like enzyme
MADDFAAFPARPRDLAPALRQVFGHLSPPERDVRVANALAMITQGEIDPQGVTVVWGGSRLIGAMVSIRLPGAGGLVWPPQAKPGPSSAAIEDCLIRQSLTWLRKGGTKVAHVILTPAERQRAAPLERNGYRHVTRLWYLRHSLKPPEKGDHSPDSLPTLGGGLTFQPYPRCDRKLFAETLLQTYEGTLDCPELNGTRDVDEIIAGHQGQGKHDPGLWWLVFRERKPVGVLLLTEMPEWDSFDLAYLGVVPAARGRGLGRALTIKALREAQRAGKRQVTLAVDERNWPARAMYQGLGFQAHEEREVFLYIWPRG